MQNESLPYPTVEHITRMTTITNPALAEGAIRALMWLDDGAPHEVQGSDVPLKFDIGDFINPGKVIDHSVQNETCGTTCCIAGAIAVFSGEHSPTEDCGITELNELFGCDEEDVTKPLSKLFFPWITDPSLYEITIEQAATTFRKYLFTGEVDWKA